MRMAEEEKEGKHFFSIEVPSFQITLVSLKLS